MSRLRLWLEGKDNVFFLDVLKHTFPMGSMTGAPKRRVMEEVGDLEPSARGWYSGIVGYINPEGSFDSSVIIRSLFYDSSLKRIKFSAGSAITYDSDPLAEYQECLLKVDALRRLLGVNS